MKKQLIWISYDLGINGDYENLYSWLDQYEARECGNNIAALHFEYEKELFDELKEDILNKINLKEGDRIYLVFKSEDGLLKGKFIVGRRKPSPWKGFAVQYEEEMEDV